MINFIKKSLQRVPVVNRVFTIEETYPVPSNQDDKPNEINEDVNKTGEMHLIWPGLSKKGFKRKVFFVLLLILFSMLTFLGSDNISFCSSIINDSDDFPKVTPSGSSIIKSTLKEEIINICTLEELRYAMSHLSSRQFEYTGQYKEIFESYERSVSELKRQVLHINPELEDIFYSIMFYAVNINLESNPRFDELYNIKYLKYFLGDPGFSFGSTNASDVILTGSNMVEIGEDDARSMFISANDELPPCLTIDTMITTNITNPFSTQPVISVDHYEMIEKDDIKEIFSTFTGAYGILSCALSFFTILVALIPTRLHIYPTRKQIIVIIVKLLIIFLVPVITLLSFWLVQMPKIENLGNIVPLNTLLTETGQGLCMNTFSIDRQEKSCYDDCTEYITALKDSFDESIIPDYSYPNSVCVMGCLNNRDMVKSDGNDWLKVLIKAAANPLFTISAVYLMMFMECFYPASWIIGFASNQEFGSTGCLIKSHRMYVLLRFLPFSALLILQFSFYGVYQYASPSTIFGWIVAALFACLVFVLFSMCYFKKWYTKNTCLTLKGVSK